MASLEIRPLSRDRSQSLRDYSDRNSSDRNSSDRNSSDPDGSGPDGSGPDGRDSNNDGPPGPDWLRPPDGRQSALTPHLPERWRGARLDPGRKGMLSLCGVGIVVLLVAGYGFLRDTPAAAPVPALPVVQPMSVSPNAPTGAEPPPTDIVVSVVGLVVSSGLKHLPPGSRVADALAAADGPRADADLLALNLAAKLNDGDQIVVGITPAEGRPLVTGTVTQGGPGPSAGDSAPANKVDLNQATAAELDALSGVGPVTAASIVAWREMNGSFAVVDQLAEVDGIGPVRLEKLRDQVTV